jgi:hypothetical protein
MRVRIEGTDLPGASFGLVGIQRGRDVIDLVPADSATATWSFEVDLRVTPEGVDLRGPYVQGRKGDRFIYLSWGRPEDGFIRMYRRAKLMFGAVDPAALSGAADATLVGRLGLTAKDGTPRCAAVRPPAIIWTFETR